MRALSSRRIVRIRITSMPSPPSSPISSRSVAQKVMVPPKPTKQPRRLATSKQEATNMTPTFPEGTRTWPPTPFFGAIVGDVAGSTYEHENCKSEQKIKLFAPYSRATDDSVLTLATARYFVSLNRDRESSLSFTDVYRQAGKRYPKAGYGRSFSDWVRSSETKPYGSWGNGSAMRVSPCGWVAESLKETLTLSRKSAEVTHNHPSAIAGAQAVAAAIFLARTGCTKMEIAQYLIKTFQYTQLLETSLDEIRPRYRFDVSCDGSVPIAILAFLESHDLSSCIKKAISVGGDSDTIAAMAGSIAHAYYGIIPTELVNYCQKKLDVEQLNTQEEFWKLFSSETRPE